ncbi:YdcF family protein [Microcoleus sp. FACHB-672]|uniref:YdcF family protein n=1 Tax=Microcoleus sp. FACHB-672 TaxID=2692825 RepID=UPI001F5563D3|nr:YdcF family protein [Microcoleus sp. FACHB-672]
MIALISFIPVRLAITLNQVPEPQAILALGGAFERIQVSARLWKSQPNLDIWISDVRPNYEPFKKIFQKVGVPENQFHYASATDTVTNFTGSVQDFVDRKIWHLYLVTSDYHMTRSRAIATLVLGSRGIVVTPISVPSTDIHPESIWRILRDCFRCLLWLVTGRTGASLHPNLHS